MSIPIGPTANRRLSPEHVAVPGVFTVDSQCSTWQKTEVDRASGPQGTCRPWYIGCTMSCSALLVLKENPMIALRTSIVAATFLLGCGAGITAHDPLEVETEQTAQPQTCNDGQYARACSMIATLVQTSCNGAAPNGVVNAERYVERARSHPNTTIQVERFTERWGHCVRKQVPGCSPSEYASTCRAAIPHFKANWAKYVSATHTRWVKRTKNRALVLDADSVDRNELALGNEALLRVVSQNKRMPVAFRANTSQLRSTAEALEWRSVQKERAKHAPSHRTRR